MDNLLQDVRFGFRMLRRNPGFTAVAILVLAVGIGANTAIFSIVNSILLQSLPFPDADRLVMLRDGPITDRNPMSYPEFLAWRDQKNIFEDAATFMNSAGALTGMGEAEQVRTFRVSANFLAMLGITPSLGRGFRPEEESREAPPVALLSQSFWKSHFHSDPAVLGQKLTLNEQVFTIVGVLPGKISFGEDPAVITPLRLNTTVAPAGLNFLPVIAKLRRDMSYEQARNAVKAAIPRIRQAGIDEQEASILPLQEYVVGRSRPLLLVLLGFVAFVLLIACANIANLLLSRAAARQKEIAIRVSLGAGRMRLVRQLLTESSLLAIMGGTLGLILGWSSLGLLKTLLADRLPRGSEVYMSGTVLAFTALLSLFTGVLFGLAPSLQAIGKNLHERLKQGGWQAASGAGSQRVRNTLVVVEITLSLMLLAGAGLLMRSFVRLLHVEKGFDPDHVVTMGFNPSPIRYSDPATETTYLQQIVRQLESLPGVRSAGLITDLPLASGSTNGPIIIQGRPSKPESSFNTNKQFVIGSYFGAMRIPLIKGRYFNEGDTSTSPRVVVVDQTFVRRYFPNEDPIGRHIDVAWGDPAWSEIIGVVGDAKQETLADSAHPTFYALISQKPELLKFLGFSLVVRTSVDPESALQAITGQIHQLDKNQAMAQAKTMDALIEQSLAPHRAPMWLLMIFSGVALFLAAIGIYGVLSYFVLQRRQELGVRMALGAQRADVLKLVFGQGARLIVIGIICGLVAAFLASRAMTSLLFGVKPTDVPTFVGVSLLLAALALVACGVPALRATQVDPLVVLRNE